MLTKKHVAITIVLLLASASPSLAQDFTWSKLYDSSTPLPGTNKNPFFLSPPAISGGNVAFSARYTDEFGDYEGVYALTNGSLGRVIDTSMTLPDSAGAVMDYTIYSPAIHGNDVALYAVGFRPGTPEGSSPWNAGIYRWSNGALARVADEQMNVPGAASKFFDFNRPDIRNGTIIFNGVDADGVAAGVYTHSPGGGPLNVVADTATRVPGRDFNFYGFPYRLPHTTLLPDGSALFLGGYRPPPPGHTSGGLFGIYRTAGPAGPLQTIAEDGVTPIPSAAPNARFLDVYTATVADDDGTVVFFGRDATTRGIYAVRDGAIQRIVDNSTLLPDGTKTFGSFGRFFDDVYFAYNNGVLLFEGYDYFTPNNNVLHGLYVATLDGDVYPLLSAGQQFDGKTIDYWLFGPDSLDSNNVGLSVHFTDGSSGIYTTSTASIAIPEPAALSLIATLALAATRPRRRPA